MPNYYGYQPQRNSNSAQHGLFKYVKREWKNGKWRYWYEDTKKDVSNFVDKNITGKTAKTNARMNTKQAERASSNFKNALNQYNSTNQDIVKNYTDNRYRLTEANISKTKVAKNLPGHIDKANEKVARAEASVKGSAKKAREMNDATTGKSAASYALEAKKYSDEAAKNKASYDKSVAGKAEKTAKQVKKAANDVAEWASDTYDNVSKTATKAIDNGKKWTKNAAEDVGDWANDTSKKAEQAIESGTEWVKNLLGGKKKKKKK